MLVYVLISLSGGVVQDVTCYSRRDTAEEAYRYDVSLNGSDDDTILYMANLIGSRIASPAEIIEESYGEG